MRTFDDFQSFVIVNSTASQEELVIKDLPAYAGGISNAR